MLTRYHTKRRALKLLADGFIRLTFDRNLRAQIRSLWGRKKITDPEIDNLGDVYRKAFTEYLHDVKVPKQVTKIVRETAKLRVPGDVPELVEQLRKIAIKRQQPAAVIIEEALQRYLDKPENYLGKGHDIKERLERLG